MTSRPKFCKPKIWRRYVDDTFTILDRDRVDVFLQHLHSQQPSIRFTMEIENNSKIAFLDTGEKKHLLSVLVSNGCLPLFCRRSQRQEQPKEESHFTLRPRSIGQMCGKLEKISRARSSQATSFKLGEYNLLLSYN